MTIVALHKPKPYEDITQGLRQLADMIEAGEIGWPVTSCAVVLGHTGAVGNPDEDGDCRQEVHWRTFGYGPRTDTFTIRGLLNTAARDWES